MITAALIVVGWVGAYASDSPTSFWTGVLLAVVVNAI